MSRAPAVPDPKAVLERHGLLLKQGRELPSVAALVAGEEVRGSWWSHPRSRAIFAALEELEDWRDALLAKIPLGRVGSAEEVAEAVAFLAAPAAAYITGHVLRINGGLAI